jgi:hypothetical protein
MSTRTHVAAALAAGAAILAVPAGASAAGPTVVAGPVKVKAYDMTVVASSGSLSVQLHRAAGKASQTHLYSTSKGVKVKVAGNLASGRVAAPLGPLGKVKLKLKATGPLRKTAPPKGCTGSKTKTRAGVLRGSFSLKADGGRYFGTIKQRSLKATVLKGGKLSCTAPNGPGQGGQGAPNTTTLSRSHMDGSQMTTYSAMRQGAKVTQSAMRMDDPAATAPVSVMHMISAPGGAFDVASDLGSASVNGAGPFLSGHLGFTADDAFGSTAIGTATGDLVAKFDPIGSVSLLAGDEPTSI